MALFVINCSFAFTKIPLALITLICIIQTVRAKFMHKLSMTVHIIISDFEATISAIYKRLKSHGEEEKSC